MDVLTDLFEEELLPNSEAMAEIVIQRLINAGFVIEPAEELKDAGRGASVPQFH